MNSENNFNSSMWQNIDDIQELLSWSDEKVSEIMDLGVEDYRHSKKLSFDLSALSFHHFSRELGIDENDLINGLYDKTALIESHVLHSQLVLPEIYSDFAYSQMSSLRHIYGMAKKYNKNDYLLKKLQISRAMLECDMRVSFKLHEDALSAMRPYFNKEDLRAIGLKNVLLLKDLSITDKFVSEHNKLVNLLEYVSEFVSRIEHNWSYSTFKVKNNQITFKASPKGELVEHFKKLNLYSAEMNVVREAFTSSLPLLKNGMMLKCNIIDNKDHCLITLDMDKGVNRPPSYLLS